MHEIISFLGLIIGIILSKEFKSELKDINKFLKITSYIILIVLILKLVLLAGFSFLFLIGLILGGLVNYFLKNNYLYYGSILMLTNYMNNDNKIFFGILIFILGLTYPVFNGLTKKKLLFAAIIFALPFTLLINNIALNYGTFIIGFSIGGLAIGFKQYNKQVKK